MTSASPPPVALPIDPLLPEIVERLRQHGVLVLEAPPGAGKTTRVPRALLESGIAGDKEVLVLQPRRLATRLAAARVAEELGEPLGQRVGYQVRFEDVSGPRTRLRFVTEGLLTRQLLGDPTLSRVGVVVLDEFHERHLVTDLALAWLMRLRREARRDLKLVVMSATLEAGPLAQYLEHAPVLRSEGRRFDVSLEYLDAPDARHLDVQVAAALKRSFASESSGGPQGGHWLVFLPGAAEIRRAQDACREFAERQGLALHTLHGDLPPAEQDRAVRPSTKRKVILSTNVAETSVTIDGVTRVVDSGLARQASHSVWSGLSSLKTGKVSRASARQRAGRAGRTQAGACLRLYTRADFDARPDQDAPEIERADLTSLVLELRAGGVTDLNAFPFFERPPAVALEAAESLLVRLGALDAARALTPLGRQLVQLPLHPRLGRLALEAARRGALDEGVTLAALLSERDILKRSGAGRTRSHGESDLLERWERFQEAEHAELSPSRLNALDLDAGAAHAVSRVKRQLARTLRRSSGANPGAGAGATLDVETTLGLSLLTAFPDRLAHRRRPGSPELLLQGGVTAQLAESSVVHHAEWLVAVDAEETPRGARVRLASAIEPEWLLELFPDQLEEQDRLTWNEGSKRVERWVRLAYGDLALEEQRTLAPPSPGASQVLRQAALDAGPTAWAADAAAVAAWELRLSWAREANPSVALPTAETLWAQALETLVDGRRSFAELREAGGLAAVSGFLDAAQRRALETSAPERVALPSGRSLEVHYASAQPPWVESRLQDFFGMAQGPTLGERRLPLVLHLLAPNGRDVQVTTDLAGFWERHYSALRRELSRRYPRHSWPEDPLHAAPPVAGPGRRPPRK